MLLLEWKVSQNKYLLSRPLNTAAVTVCRPMSESDLHQGTELLEVYDQGQCMTFVNILI